MFQTTNSRPAIPPAWPYDAAILARMEQDLGHAVAVDRRTHEELRCDLRFVRADELDELHALHRHVLDALPHPHILRSDSREFMAMHIDWRGRTIGAYCHGRLIAYAVIAFPGSDADNLGPELGVPPEEHCRVAHYDGSGVHPDYRGSHLHQVMNALRGRYAGFAGYYHLAGTVSPRNPFSLGNHLGAGFMVKGVARKYGGMDRLLIYRDWTRRAVISPAVLDAAERVPLLDVARHEALAADQYWGVRLERGEAGDFVVYVPSREIETVPLDVAELEVAQ